MVMVVVAAMVFPLAACKRATSESKYDPAIDPPASQVRVNIDPSIKDKQDSGGSFAAAPAATATPAQTPATETKAVDAGTDAKTTDAETTPAEDDTPREAASAIDTSAPEETPAPAESDEDEDDED